MKKTYKIPALRDVALEEEKDFLKSAEGSFNDLTGEDYDVEW